jgi:2-deoxy-D-gluconate 3-dehydrogenase
MTSDNSYLLSLFSLEGKTALCTGCTRGIGQSMALALARAGADIVLVQRNSTNLETFNAVKQAGRKATIVECDLADNQAVKRLVKHVTSPHNQGGLGIALDIVVNCG